MGDKMEVEDINIEAIKDILKSETKIPVNIEQYIRYTAQSLFSKKLETLDVLIKHIKVLKSAIEHQKKVMEKNGILNNVPEIINISKGLHFSIVGYESGAIYIYSEITVFPNKIKYHRKLRQYNSEELKRWKVKGIYIQIVYREGKMWMHYAWTPKSTHINTRRSLEWNDVIHDSVHPICMGTLQGAEFTYDNLRGFIKELEILNLDSGWRHSNVVRNKFYNDGTEVEVMEVD